MTVTVCVSGVPSACLGIHSIACGTHVKLAAVSTRFAAMLYVTNPTTSVVVPAADDLLYVGSEQNRLVCSVNRVPLHVATW